MLFRKLSNIIVNKKHIREKKATYGYEKNKYQFCH